MSRAVPVGAGGDPDTGTGLLLHQVGPNGSMASDAQFGLALTTLWHTVSEAGGAVGFVPGTPRPDVARRSAALLDAIRRGSIDAIAVTADRTLVGFAALRAGTGVIAHTGDVGPLMVDPGLQGSGLGALLMQAVLDLARGRGLERLSLSARDGHGLPEFYRRFGFVEWGRRPGWVRVAGAEAPGGPDDRDEILLSVTL
ncbi:MAG: GNAT family N-acetyltransferase [Nakamurella sp.]